MSNPVACRLALLAAAAGLVAGPAHAQDVAPPPDTQPIANDVATFTGLDKITGRLDTFDVLLDQPLQWGGLIITPRACYSQPAERAQQTATFVQIDEITLEGEVQRIFSGWMFAESPGLNAVEHPVYDVWLTACKPMDQYIDPTLVAEAPDDAPTGPEYIGGIPIPRPKPTTVPQQSQSFRNVEPEAPVEGEGGPVIELPPPA